jgi:RHS repeat-associated protein
MGGLVSCFGYTVFDLLMCISNSTPTPFHSASKQTDLESGLVNFGFRFYSPALGRWTVRDYLSEFDAYNLFLFAQNNPMSFFDTIGLFSNKNCDPAFATKIQNAETAALETITRWLDYLEQQDSTKLFIFLQAHNIPNGERELLLIFDFFNEFKSKLEKLRDGIKASSYSISCECDCETGWLFRSHHDAWVRLSYLTGNPTDDTIHFCKDLETKGNQTNLSSLLFHEFSHYFLSTSDSYAWTFSIPMSGNLDLAQFYQLVFDGGKTKGSIQDVLRAWFQRVFGTR